MNCYPSDWVSGAVPLVYAVNAILPPPPPVTHEEPGEDGTFTLKEREESTAGVGRRHRDLEGAFDKFVDAMGSMVGDEEAMGHHHAAAGGDDATVSTVASESTGATGTTDPLSYFAADRAAASSTAAAQQSGGAPVDDGAGGPGAQSSTLGGHHLPAAMLSSMGRPALAFRGKSAPDLAPAPAGGGITRSLSEESSGDEFGGVGGGENRSSSPRMSNFFRKRSLRGLGGGKSSSSSSRHSQQHAGAEGDAAATAGTVDRRSSAASSSASSTSSPSFQKARIVPVSKRHSFPPSKDPSGMNNPTLLAAQLRASSHQQMQRDRNFPSFYPHPAAQPGAVISDVSSTAGGITMPPLPPPPPVEAAVTLRGRSTSADYFFSHQGSDDAGGGPQQQGILPAGWLEKHAHALPSVVLVVTVVDLALSPTQRVQQDDGVGDVVDNLRSSLASKRECRIHLVCIVVNHDKVALWEDDDKARQVEARQLANLRAKCRLAQSAASALHYPEDFGGGGGGVDAAGGGDVLVVKSSTAASRGSTSSLTSSSKSTPDPLHSLYRTVRQCSQAYYLAAARRAKKKLNALPNTTSTGNGGNGGGGAQTMVINNHHLLPLTIRYHFKVGVFYEFQGRIEKSLKYYEEAYRNVDAYYRFLVSHYAQIHRQQALLGLGAGAAQRQQIQPPEAGGEGHAPAASGHGAAPRPPDVVGVGVQRGTADAGEGESFGPYSTPARTTTRQPPVGGAAGDHPAVPRQRQQPPPPPTTVQSPAVGDSGVEVSLLNTPKHDSESSLPFAADDVEGGDPESGTYRRGEGGPSTPPPREVRLTSPSTSAQQPAQLAYTSTLEGASDLAHQCRGVADWLNFKILKASFAASSSSNDHLGLVAAAAQWRRHAQVFLSPPEASGEHELVYLQPSWHQWSYVAHQRLVISQIAERYPPPTMDRALSGTPGPFGEAMLHCSAWRQYEATAEAMLRLRGELRREAGAMESLEQRQREMLLQSTYHAVGDHQQHRQKFVGGLDSEGLAPRFESEMTRDHAALSLECIQRALSIFHHEYSGNRSDASQSTKGDDADDEADGKSIAPSTFSLPIERPRSSARLHYVAGNVLLTMGRYAEAMEHLECAASQVWSWSGMELAIGKALLRCIELMPPAADVGGRRSWEVAMFLLCRGDVSRRLSPNEIRRLRDVAFPGIAAIDVTSSAPSSGMGRADGSDDRTMIWPMEFNSEAPFSFALTFPRSTNAVAGDVVHACLSLKSCLSFEVAVSSLDVFTSVGTTHVPMSLPDRPNEHNEAHTTDQVRQNHTTEEPTLVNISPNKVVFFKVPILLPSESAAAVSLGGSKAGLGAGAPSSGKPTATNASSLRTTKPKSSGFTRAGGACLLPIAKDDKTAQRELSSASASATKKKGNIPMLATKQVICNGIRVGIIPLRDDDAGRSVRPVQISFQADSFGSPKNKTREGKSQSLVARQSQEEGNYTFFAWARPVHHPFYLGPSCLRVQAPIAQLDVTDLTSMQTKGMAMDGTINRVVIRLKAGELEHCSDIKFKVVCSNSIPSMDSVSAKASNTVGNASSSQQEKNELPVRCAIMVVKDESMNTEFVTKQGVHIPLGWKLQGRDGLDTQDENCPVSTNLRPGQETFVHLDFFRPLSNEPIISSSSCKDLDVSYDGCMTDYEVVFTYRQKRQQPTQTRNADRESEGNRDVPVLSAGDLVSCRHHGVIRWCSPLEAHFSIKPGSQKTFPCGSRHPQNLLKAISSDREKRSTGDDDGIPRGTTIIDGEPFLVRCTLESVEAGRGLVAEVSKIRFKKPAGESGCDLDLIPAKSDSAPKQDDIIFTSASGGDSDLLKRGGKLGLRYTVKASIKDKTKTTGQFALSPPINVGIISVEWMPVPLVLPQGLISVHDNNNVGKDWIHGPLVLAAPLKMEFFGPLCQVERVPFEAALDAFPDSPHVAIPFDVKYCVKNKTGLHQKLAVSMTDTSSMQGSDSAADGVLVSGLVNGDIFLAPYESTTLGYSALATKAGKTPLPALTVASTRYQSWVINDGPKNPRHFFVLP